MLPIHLSRNQIELVERPLEGSLFLEGPAGTGKTTTGIERMLHLLAQGVRGDAILLLLPELTLATPYPLALQHRGVDGGGEVQILTLASLAQRMIERFWSQTAETGGFNNSQRGPVFLNFEMAEYILTKLVEPLLEGGYFSTVTLERNRLVSQLLGNLNRSAASGIPMEEIGSRFLSAWSGGKDAANEKKRLATEIQETLEAFRRYCLFHNLLDFSLQIEFFSRHVWSLPACQEFFYTSFQHLIMDNLEENVPVTHDLALEWLPHFLSALLIYNHEDGFHSLLGTDQESGYRLKDACQATVKLTASFVTSQPLEFLLANLQSAVHRSALAVPPNREFEVFDVGGGVDLSSVLECHALHFYPQMLDWACQQVERLVKADQVTPDEIAVLVPYLPGALHFSLTNRLERFGISAYAHRPSRPLGEEPAVQCLVSLAFLAHPDWGIHPARDDLVKALVVAIEGLDLVRAELLAEVVFHSREGQPVLSSFDRIGGRMQERITRTIGQRYDYLLRWLEQYMLGRELPLEEFLDSLVEDVLSKPGFGFSQAIEAEKTAGQLIEAAQNFRYTLEGSNIQTGRPVGAEYLLAVQGGLLPARYISGWQIQPENAVLLSPAYPFVRASRTVDYQVWLDVGSRAWHERPSQPLSHPHILHRSWPAGKSWGEAEELAASQEVLSRLVTGLVRRCRQKIYCGISELDERGYAQSGHLLGALRMVQSGELDSV